MYIFAHTSLHLPLHTAISDVPVGAAYFFIDSND